MNIVWADLYAFSVGKEHTHAGIHVFGGQKLANSVIPHDPSTMVLCLFCDRLSLSGTLQIRLGWLAWLATCLNLLSAEVMSMHNQVVLLQLSAENRTPVLLVALPALH